MRSTIAAVLLCVATAAAAGEIGPLADRAGAKERAASILAPGTYQTSLPGETASFQLPVPPAIGQVLEIVLWSLVALAVLVVAVIAVQAFRRARGPGAPSATDAVAGASGLRARGVGPTLDDADGLAAEGRYRDAVHLLLLVAIGEASRATEARFPPSTTSRELTRILPLREQPRARFGELVASVERSLFGGNEVGAVDYAACRERCLGVAGRTS